MRVDATPRDAFGVNGALGLRHLDVAVWLSGSDVAHNQRSYYVEPGIPSATQAYSAWPSLCIPSATQAYSASPYLIQYNNTIPQNYYLGCCNFCKVL